MLGELYAGSLADAERRRELISIDVLEKNALSNVPALDALKFLAPLSLIHI